MHDVTAYLSEVCCVWCCIHEYYVSGCMFSVVIDEAL